MDSTWGSLPSSNSMKMEEKLCAALLPIVLIVDALIHVCARCFDCHESTGRREPRYGFKDFVRLSQETQFTVNELEALNVLFKKLSRSIIDDDLIHKEELQLALFKSNFGENLFLDRVFDLFDQKRNGVIDFEEFVRSLNVFHPLTPLDVKLEFSFRLYDLRQTGFIEREEVKQMVAAILKESNLDVSDEMLQNITDRADNQSTIF